MAIPSVYMNRKNKIAQKLLLVYIAIVLYVLYQGREFLLPLIGIRSQKNSSANETTNQQLEITEKIQNKINTYGPIKRVEIRTYIKNKNHPYQDDINEIRKIKIKSDLNSKNYLEINFFTNESDQKAPLVAQFLLIDDFTKNIIEETGLNIKPEN